MNVKKKTFRPSVGKVVELPTDIRRKDAFRFGGGNGSNGQLSTTVIGTGDMTEWVVLRFDDDEAVLPEGAEVLGSDVYRDATWYIVRKSNYGSDD